MMLRCFVFHSAMFLLPFHSDVVLASRTKNHVLDLDLESSGLGLEVPGLGCVSLISHCL
jgi:hypothetical protein